MEVAWTTVRTSPRQRRCRARVLVLFTFCLFLCPIGIGARTAAQDAAPPVVQASPADDLVVVNVPEQVDLQVLVDYVGRTLNIRFFYAEDIKGRRIDLRPSPLELPRSRLLHLLASLLRVHDLVLVEEAPGLFRIIQAEQSQRSVTDILPADAAVDADSLRIVTQVLRVPSGKVEGLPDKVARYLSSPKGGLIPIPERGLLIVTDYAARIALIKELIALMDQSGNAVAVETVDVPVGHGSVLAEQVQAVLSETHRARGLATPPPSIRANILPDKLLLVGSNDELAEAKSLLQRLRPPGVSWETRLYRPNYLDLQRLRHLIDHVVLAPGSGLHAPAKITVDEGGGRLVVTAEAATHQAIAQMLDREDQPSELSKKPVRLYRPKHRKAADVLATLTHLLGEGALLDEVSNPVASQGAALPAPGKNLPEPAAVTAAPRALSRIAGPDYVLAADPETNAIVAIGTREFHAQLEVLLDELDRKRPQVLIEMTLVAITLNDGVDLGVELEDLDLGDAWDFLAFSNFGLSTIDPVTGARTLIPGIGANGVLLNPEETPILFRALARRGKAKVLSTPKLLVSDHAKGTLRNVDEAPFTSVNASDTVATTSFAGFESAGTTLSVTPHIAEGDHLILEYELSFSNFTGSSSTAAVPPPRTTNSFASTVDVPDGYTVITGGLIVDNDSDAISEVPVLGRIPVLGKLFQSSSKNTTQTKIFAFIRPVILRDDAFEDLKMLSIGDLSTAELTEKLAPLMAEMQWMR